MKMDNVNAAVVWRIGVLAVTLVCMGQRSQAQVAAKDTVSPIVVAGFVDTYFSWNFDKPSSHINRLANFDLTENQFVMSMAAAAARREEIKAGSTWRVS
jgi:hypothetical protein